MKDNNKIEVKEIEIGQIDFKYAATIIKWQSLPRYW